jgi:replicative DNA helicase
MKVQNGSSDGTGQEAVQSVEAEQQVLGALLLDNETYHTVSGQIEAGDFFEPLHGRIFDCIAARVDAGSVASPITLKSDLASDGALKDLGFGYLAKLVGAAASRASLKEYVTYLIDLKAKRELISISEEAKEHALHGAGPAHEIASKLEQKAGGLISRTTSKPMLSSHLAAVTEAVANINAIRMGEREPGIPSGIRQLDDLIGGFLPGRFYVVAGRPSMGKTTAVHNFAWNAQRAGKGVFFASLEMPKDEMATRLVSRGLIEKGHRVAYSNMLRGRVSEEEMRCVVEEVKAHVSIPIYYGERHVRNITRLRSAAKRAHQQLADSGTPLGMIVVDYVQLISDPTARDPRVNVSRACALCKDLAMELNVPVIACAQLSRAVEMRDPPVPMLSDLKESGSLEEDADVVIFCYRAEYYLQRAIDAGRTLSTEDMADLEAQVAQVRNEIDYIVAKQRGGPVGQRSSYIDLAHNYIASDYARSEGHLI